MKRSSDTTTIPRPQLRAVPGGREGAAGEGITAPLDECVISRRAVRAGDRHEPWTLAASPALRALAGSAYAVGIDVELAVRIALESELACADLSAAGVDPVRLDAIAEAERVDGQLDAAACAYLRRLTHERGAACHVGDTVTVGLPLRLSSRLLRADLDALLATADIARAIRWETAAVLTGRTISEWAPLAALRALAPAPDGAPAA